MEITNHGRGLALTMGWASMHVCVLLGFCYAVINVFCWGFGYAVINVFCWDFVVL